MKKIRVLIVDDSVIVRNLLSDVLSSDPDLEVVAPAPRGRIARAGIPQFNPDLVTLDDKDARVAFAKGWCYKVRA